MESYLQGTIAGAGTFRCEQCDFAVALQEQDAMPVCPHCRSERFRRSSLFAELADAEPWGGHAPADHVWLAGARYRAGPSGQHLAWCDDEGEVWIAALAEEWTRVGRSPVAEIRFDDPTVSRRHALLHREGTSTRILDDRSLNGVFVNGEKVAERALADGDELSIGRFALRLIAPAAPAARRLFRRSAAS